MKRSTAKQNRWPSLAALFLAASLATACGRSTMLGEPDDEPVGGGGNVGPVSTSAEIPATGGQAGAAISSSKGGAGAGGSKASLGGSGGSSVSSSSSSKPIGGSSAFAGSKSLSSSSSLLGGAGTMSSSGGVSTSAGSKSSSSSGGVSSSAGSKATGGSSATGGTTSTVNCKDAKSCGGDVVGTWTVTSSCLTVAGEADLGALGLTCKRAAVDGSLQVTGAWNAMSNGTYVDKTTTTGRLQMALPASCLNLSGTTISCSNIGAVIGALGFGKMTCTSVPAGGCSCSGDITQTGSVGVVTFNPTTNGTYKTSGNTLVMDGDTRYGYCITGVEQTLIPQPTFIPTTGTIVLKKQ